MFGQLSFWGLMVQGGWTMLLLLCFSIVSLAIIAERTWACYQSKTKNDNILDPLKHALKKKDLAEAIAECDSAGGILGRVFKEGLMVKNKGTELMRDVMIHKAKEELFILEKYTAVVGTIGNVAPFVGLFGTVLGVIRAFKDVSMAGGAGTSVVMNGIAEALVTTAAGLFVAVPAVIGYNYLVTKIERMGLDIENKSDQLIDVVTELER